jgi:hypothetical protein
MKNKLIILICLLASCQSDTKIIYTKDYLPKDKPCICNYAYDKGFIGTIWFQDSCNKYNIGDTIK